MIRKICLMVCTIFFGQIASSAYSEPFGRAALLILNENYSGAVQQPTTAAKDTALLAESLRKNKFDVSIASNLNFDAMQKAVKAFADKTTPGSLVVFYFNGFGIQVDRQTFLIPVEASIWSESDVKVRGISIDAILSELDKKAKIKTVILDAARRNPIERRFRAYAAGIAGVDSSDRTLTILPSRPGQTTENGTGDVSPFMRELVKSLDKPGLSAEDAMAETKNAVAKSTDGHDVPWVSSSLKEPFTFAPPQQPDHGAAAPPPVLASVTTATVKDCNDCPDLVVMATGVFSMGSNESRYTRPIHRVSIDHAYAIARTPVTFEDWNRCVAAAGCTHRPSDEGWGEATRPVINVSWTDAKQYLTWLGKKAGHPYRLPSEAEWEYAAHGGTATKFWWGPNVGRQMANCRDCLNAPVSQTSPVGSYAANPFGLLDMGGNVAQWVDDCWNDSYKGAPKDGSSWSSGECELRVLRGGSFLNSSNEIQPASRFRYDSDVRYYANGFRVARDMP